MPNCVEDFISLSNENGEGTDSKSVPSLMTVLS